MLDVVFRHVILFLLFIVLVLADPVLEEETGGNNSVRIKLLYTAVFVNNIDVVNQRARICASENKTYLTDHSMNDVLTLLDKLICING